MVFRVEISPSALQDIENILIWMTENYPEIAEEWYFGILDAIQTLNKFPNRCSLAPENEEIGSEIRQLLYKQHRIIFRIIDDSVFIYRIRHIARDRIVSEDLQ
ncbi:MAG: type II toxin-antitoxin system RelE/ParE family toxin [Cyanobacteria bacterium P01_E01_bin.42]